MKLINFIIWKFKWEPGSAIAFTVMCSILLALLIFFVWIVGYAMNQHEYCVGLTFEEIYSNVETYYFCKNYAPEVMP